MNSEYDHQIAALDHELELTQIQAREYIENFAETIKKIDKSQLVGTSVKFKIPFKLKIKRFFEKLNKTLN